MPRRSRPSPATTVDGSRGRRRAPPAPPAGVRRRRRDPLPRLSRRQPRRRRRGLVAPSPVRRADDAELLHAETQRVGMDAQAFRRVAGAVDPPAAALRAPTRCARAARIEIVRSPAAAAAPGRPSASGSSSCSVSPLLSDHRALDDVLELADVARPRVALQRVHHRLRHLRDVPPEVALVAVDEEPDQPRDVLGALPQRRAGESG